jgi:hypothetical protein
MSTPRRDADGEGRSSLRYLIRNGRLARERHAADRAEDVLRSEPDDLLTPLIEEQVEVEGAALVRDDTRG